MRAFMQRNEKTENFTFERDGHSADAIAFFVYNSNIG